MFLDVYGFLEGFQSLLERFHRCFHVFSIWFNGISSSDLHLFGDVEVSLLDEYTSPMDGKRARTYRPMLFNCF